MPSLLQPRLRGRPHFLGHRGNRRPHFVQRDLLQLRRLVSALAYQKPVELLAAGQYGRVSQSEVIRDVHRGPLWAVVPDFFVAWVSPVPLLEQLAIASTDRSEQVATWYNFDMATRCEKLCNQTPAAAVMVNDQVIASGDTAGDRIDHVVDELDRKPMLAQGSASGRGRHVGTNPIPPACGIGLQDCLSLAMAAHCAALRNAGRRSTGFSFSVFAAGGAGDGGTAAGLTRSPPLAATAAASRDARTSASLAAACSASRAVTSPA